MIISMREIIKGKLIYVVGKGSVIVFNCVENNILPKSLKIGDCVAFNSNEYQITGIEGFINNNIGLIVTPIYK